MKKIYLLLVFCCLNFATFASTWYSNPAGGDASALASWWSTSGGTGTHPANFTTAGDIWTIQSSMTVAAATWTVAGTLTLTSGSLVGTSNTINIGGSLALSGSAFINSSSTAMFFYVGGDFTMSGSSYITNSPSFTYIHLNNPASTLASPQHISWTAGALGNWTYVYVDAGCTTQMTATCTWTASGYPLEVDGTLDCQNFAYAGASPFILASGGTLYTGSATGVNGALTTTGTKTFTTGCGFGFNGTVAQVTGSTMPTTISAPGSLTINNTTGVTLSQNTTLTGTLAFTNGILNTGANTLTVPGAAASVTGAGAGKYVNGNLSKTIAGLTSLNYEVGDATYAPVLLTLSGAGTGGSIGVKSTGGLHPQIASSGFVTSQIVNHYWTVTNIGAAGPATATFKATYNLGDIIGGSNTTFVNQKYSGGTWMGAPQATTNTSAPYTSTVNGGINLNVLQGDYIFGVPGPAVFSTPTSLDFGLIGTSTFSPSQTISISGSTLTPSGGTITITPPLNFQVSLDNSLWFTNASPLLYTYSGTAFAGVTVYVRFNPTVVGPYSGNIAITGGGLAAPTNIALTGNGGAACSGIPTPGVASVTPGSGYGITPFSLSLTGATVAGGITYQWQSATSGTGPFTNIPGASTATYNFTGIAANTYYQAVVTCPSFTAATSNTVTASFAPVPGCTPSATANVSWSSPGSYSFGVGTVNVTAATGPNLSDGSIFSAINTTTAYLSRTGSIAPIILYKGNSYPGSVAWGSTSSAEYTQIWIDFNNDGTFSTSEEVTPIFATGYSSTTVNPVNFSLTIPLGAASGVHLMRMRSIWELSGTGLGSYPAHMDPCLFNYGGSNPNYFSGTVVDYYVDVENAPACAGTPTAGTVSASVGNSCSSFTSNLSLTGSSAASGLTYQWSSSPDNSTWTPVAGATGNTYTANVTSSIYYRCQVTCTASAQSATTPGTYLYLAATPTNATLPYYESFENPWANTCATADVPNNSWRNQFLSGSGAWRREDDGPGPNTAAWTLNTSYAYTPGGSIAGGAFSLHSARFHQGGYCCGGSQSSFYLYVNLPAGNIQINYDMIDGSSTTGANNTIQLQLSTDGGSTYTNIGPARQGPIGWTTWSQNTIIAAATPGILRWLATTDYGSYDIGIDNVSVFVNTPCTAPATQPTALTLTPALFNITGSFTPSVPAANKYLVIMTTTNVAPAAPVNGTSYYVGNTTLGGTVVSSTNYTTYNVAGLTPGTHYWFWVYGFNDLCTGGPLYNTVAPLSNNIFTTACSMSGIKVVGPTGDYPTLTAAIAAVNANGLAGPLALELQTTYTGTGETYPITINNIPCASATNTLTIRPQGTLTISYGAGSTPFIDLNGANYVIIDGRVGSTGFTKALTIATTNTGAQSIRFTNDASNNIVRWCTVTSVNTSTVQGTIFFYITNGTTGNDNNLIDNCDILDGATMPFNAIYSAGTTGKENDHNTVSNCNIANFFAPASASNGIFLSTASTDWTINNNRFYQTGTRTFTSGVAHRAIQISNTSGKNFTVTNNTIGSASSAGTGICTMTGAVACTYQGILMSVGNTLPSNVQGNTITNISLTTTSTSATVGGALCGISVTSGTVNVGTTAPNIIGAATGNGAITLTPGSLGMIVGINSSAASPAAVNIQNNIIGSLTAVGTATTGASINGIQVSSSASLNISGNTIGSTTTANSLYSSFNTTSAIASLVYGIQASISLTPVVPWVISNNIISNLTSATTSTTALTGGILLPSGTNTPGTISGNTIKNISSATANTIVTGQCGVTGIGIFGNTLPVVTVTQNTINALSNTNAAAIGTSVCGIGTTNAPAITITRNNIYDLRNANTGTTATTPPKAIGILWVSPSTTGPTITNNMISLGNGQTTNTSFVGIMNGASTALTANVYYNTVNIEGTAASGALPTACFHRGTFAAALTTPVDIRNNIFNNVRTGGTGKHYAIANALGATGTNGGWAAGASNYNILNAAAATVGYWGAADKTFATWKTASLSDNNSNTASTVTFTNSATGDLHINMGVTPNNIESHGVTIPGINTDYDNQARPGPTSVNGGGFSPDLGADEFDGTPTENLPPAITYTTLLNSCGTGDRTFTANIIDPSSVPTSGTQPRVYYKKGAAGTWFSQPGTLSSGTAANGTWSFTIVAGDMGGLAIGDQVYYYVIAQDVPGNIGSIPSAGLVATDVNTVTTPPTTPNVYNVSIALGGNYTVGASGTYTTIGAAATAYNGACLTGPVTFSLTDAAYPGETFPIILGANPYANVTNTLTIQPAPGTAVAINGGAGTTSIFKFLNSSYITLNGVSTGGASLAINGNNTGANTLIWLASTTGVGPGNKFITLKNMNLTGGGNTATTSSWAILSGVDGASPSTTAGMDNDNITIQGNTFQKVAYGIYAFGTAFSSAGGLDNWLISGNTFGPATYSATNNIGYNGMWLGSMMNPVITGNTIQNVGLTTLASQTLGIGFSSNVNGGIVSQNTLNGIFSNYATSGTSNTCGIYFGTTVINSSMIRNNITNIYDANTGGYAPRAITVVTNFPTSNDVIANNMITNIYGPAWSIQSESPAGIAIEGSSGGIQVYYNSINLATAFAGANIASFSMGLYLTTTGGNIDVRNNIFVNTYDNTTVTTDKSYAIWSSTPASSFSNIDYNDYYTTGISPIGNIAGVDRNTLADMQAGFGGNTHSLVNVLPYFSSPTDLHLQVTGQNVPFIAGTPVGITIDFNGTTRSGTTPVLGAHEVIIPPCTSVAPGFPVAVSANLCVSGSTTINTTGATSAAGIVYQWKSSTDSVNWTSIAGATNVSYTIAPAITATTYYRNVITCNLTGNKDSSTTKVRVNPLPNITVFPDGGAYCSGSTLTMGASGAANYSWSPASGLSSTNTSAVTTNTGGTTAYTVTGTDINGCSNTHVSTVNVTTTPPAATITAAQSAFCSGGSTQLTASANLPPTILSQNFNSGLGSWSVVNTGAASTYNWAITAPGAYTDFTITGDGSNFMEADPNLAGSGVHLITSLMTPSFSTAGYTSAQLAFNYYCFSSSTYDQNAEIDYSTDGGATWILLNDYFNTTSGVASWSVGTPTQTITLPPAMLNQGNVKLRWYFNSTWGFYWALDNVNITGTGNYSNFSWSPTADLYNDAALTSPYTGSITPTVYAAPAAPLVTANRTYIANVINGTCINSTGSKTLTVNPLPAVITGNTNVCAGSSITLSNAVAGGTWTSSSPNATVIAATGVVTGVTAGTANITYSLGTGCNRYVTITVNPLPAAITGNADVCIGATNMLSSATLGGIWSSSAPATATISTIGGLGGVIAGNATISYTLSTGCTATVLATVNVLPVVNVTPATSNTICMGGNIPFTASAPVAGVTLMSQDFNSGLAGWSVSSSSGAPASNWNIVPSPSVEGPAGDGTPMMQADALSSGGVDNTILTSTSFSTIGYASANLTFNQSMITDGTDAVIAVEYSVNNGPWNVLQNFIPDGFINAGGSWSAGTPDATIPLPAAAIGQPNVRIRWNYNASSFYWMIDNVSVNALPPAATYAWTGNAADLTCNNCANPTITPAVLGLNAYSVTATTSHNCMTTVPVTVSVNPMPSVIGGTPVVCVGATTVLTNTAGSGTWTSSSPTTAFVGASTGVVTGITAGVATITYTLTGGCFTTVDVTVNPSPLPITGTQIICSGFSTTLNEVVTGGTWSSNVPTIASVDASGVVTGVQAGVVGINYTLAAGCKATAMVTVNANPSPISGTLNVCEGFTTALGNSLNGGTWSSSAPANGSVDITTGVVTGIAAGNAAITYAMPTGCMSTANVVVNTTPAPISGTPVVCENATTALSDATSVGIWTSTSPANATVTPTGVVSGIAAGNATISYTLITGCYATRDVTVNATPAAITGTFSVCEGQTTTLTNITPAGTWTSTLPAVAAIDPVLGIATGMAAGTTAVSYTLSTGCYAMDYVTVNASPAVITGTPVVCEGLATTLSNTVNGGAWTTSNGTVATVSASGVVTGVLAGNADITYTLPGSCAVLQNVTVNPTPAPITGTFSVCEGTTTVLNSITAGGTWMSTSPTAGIVDGSGNFAALLAGVTNIVYTLPEGCTATHNMVVNPAPSAISGTPAVCEGQTTALTDLVALGTWATSSAAIATVTSGGTVSGILAGNATITYTLPGGCTAMMDVTVNPSPAAITGTASICQNATTTLSNTVTGGTWASSTPGVATVNTSGLVSGVSGGTATITYTLPAGCNTNQVVTINISVPAVSVAQNITGTICQGTSVTFTATPVNGGTAPVYTWKVNGATAAATGNTYTYSPANGDIVKTVLHSNHACAIPDSAVNTLTMSISPNVMPAITVSANPGTNVCKNTIVTYTSAAVNGGTAPQYTWVVNGGVVNTTSSSYTYIPNDLDIVYCVLKSSANCVLDTAVYSNNELMTVDPGLIPIVNIKPLNSYIGVGEVDSFVAMVTNGGAHPIYKWFINSIAVSGATNATFSSGALHNNDSITVQVINDGACGLSTFNSVVIKVRTTGITPVATTESDLRLIPNPNNGDFVVSGTLGTTTDEEVSMEITDMLGQTVYKGNATAHAGSINERIKLSNTLANGMYMLNVKTANESKAFHFVLKQ